MSNQNNAYIMSDALIETCYTRSVALKCEKTTTTKSIFSISNEFFAFTFQFKLINLVFNSHANDSGSLKKKQMWEKIMFGRQNNKQPNWRNGNFSSKMNKFAMNARANFSIDCFNDVYSDLELAALDAIDSIVIACYSFASKFATKNSVFLFYKKNRVWRKIACSDGEKRVLFDSCLMKRKNVFYFWSFKCHSEFTLIYYHFRSSRSKNHFQSSRSKNHLCI